MSRAVAAGLSLLLAACAATPPYHSSPAAASAAPLAAPRPATATPSSAELFVDAATAMLGQPYRYGGAAPGGFDCSGLVVFAAAGAGFQLPRTAHEQMRVGSPVARGEVRGGDLVFMRLKSKELHVGIAIDSDRFVHAPSSGGHVRIDFLARAPYARGFLEARRVANGTMPPLS